MWHIRHWHDLVTVLPSLSLLALFTILSQSHSPYMLFLHLYMQAYLRAEVWQIPLWFLEHRQQLFLQGFVTPQSVETLCHISYNFWHRHIEQRHKRHAESFPACESHGSRIQNRMVAFITILLFQSPLTKNV